MSASPAVAIVMGSASDAEALAPCRDALAELGIPFTARVLSAHRTPDELACWLDGLPADGVRVVVAAAGLSAHLAGVCAAHTLLPVLGVPLAVGPLQGVDALLSTVQMPAGVPVATFGIGTHGARNAAFAAARILALSDPALARRLADRRAHDAARILEAGLPAGWDPPPTGRP